MQKVKTKAVAGTKIDSEAWYSLNAIVRGRIFPTTSFWSVRKMVENNLMTLKPRITGEGRGRKYYFRGENIKRFLEALKTGKAK